MFLFANLINCNYLGHKNFSLYVMNPAEKSFQNFVNDILVDSDEFEADSDDDSFQHEEDESDVELMDYSSESDLANETFVEEMNNDEIVEETCSAETEEWTDDLKPIRNFDFDFENCGVTDSINSNTTPYEIFKLMIDDDIVDNFVKGTNDYAKGLWEKIPAAQGVSTRKNPKSYFSETNRDEITKFFGLCFLQGQIKTPSIRSLFSKHPLDYIPIFGAMMSGRRFQTILRCLNFHSSELNGTSRLRKVKPLLYKLIHNFKKAYKPGKELSLDESLLLFRGRLSFRIYLKNKRARYGVKFYELSTHDGYVLNLEIYQGKDPVEENESNSSNSKTQNIVFRLMDPYLDKGHHIYMDNYYNSVKLSTLLLDRKTHSTGTLRSNRKQNPKEVTSKKLKKGELIWKRKDEVYVTKWKDKREVLSITTAHHPQLVEAFNKRGQSKMKSIDVENYTKNMSGIDRSDQMTAYYSSPRKTIRWYKKVIFHLLDLAIWNGYFIYKKFHPKVSLLQFRKLLIADLIQLPADVKEGKQLINLVTARGRPLTASTTVLPFTSSASSGFKTHFLEKIPFPENYKGKRKISYFKKCRQCSKLGKRKETSLQCKTCFDHPPLCPTCFETYHF